MLVSPKTDSTKNEGLLFFLFFGIVTTTIIALAGAIKRKRTDSSEEEEQDGNESPAMNHSTPSCLKLWCTNILDCFCRSQPTTPLWRTLLNKICMFLITSLASATASLIITYFCSNEDQNIEEVIEKVFHFVLGDEDNNERQKRDTLSQYLDQTIHAQALWTSALTVSIVWMFALATVAYCNIMEYRRERKERRNQNLSETVSRVEEGVPEAEMGVASERIGAEFAPYTGFRAWPRQVWSSVRTMIGEMLRETFGQ